MHFTRGIIYAACIVSLQVNSEPLLWTCDNTQYVQFGHGATLSCTFPPDFLGVYWYDSPAVSANLIIRREQQVNGEYTTSGVGYTNGSYDVFQNGTLLIANVSSAHDRVFLVTLVDIGRISKNFEVNVVTLFNAGQLHPSVSACPNTSLCLVNSFEADTLSCSYSNARPAVTLSWEFSPRQQEMEVVGFSTSSRGFTYSSYSVLNITNHLQKPLTAVSCSASGPALGFNSTESTVVIDISNPIEMVWQEMEAMEKIAAAHTRLDIKCAHDIETMALLWKAGDITSSEILMFLSDGQMRQNQRVKSFIKFSVDGTMTFPDVTIHAEGTYTCVYTDGETYNSKATKVIVAESRGRGIATLTLSLLIVGSVVLLLIVTALLTVFVKYLRTNCQESPQNSRASNEEEFADTQLLPVPHTAQILIVEEVEEQLLPQKTWTSVLKEFADTLSYWPFHKLSNTNIFDPEIIATFRIVSSEIDENRREENKSITDGSTAGRIVGGVFATVVAALLIVAASAAVGPAGVAAVVAGANIAATRDKLKKDEQQVNRVKVPLKTFIQIQTQLAKVIVYLDLAYHFIPSLKATSCKDANKVQEIERCIQDLKGKHNLEIGTLQKALTHIHDGTVALLGFISNAASSETDTLVREWEDKLDNAKENPFEMLDQSIKNLVVSDMSNGKMTLLTLIKLLYLPKQGISHPNPAVDVQNPENVNLQVELAHGGLLFGRTALTAANEEEDFAEVGKSVYKIARGVSVAGALLGSPGIVAYDAFLRNAIIDANEDKKGTTSQAISDVADYMQIMNMILREFD